LSDDIQRWLADEPVAAHAERWGERAFRWIRNHRTLSTVLAVAYLAATLAIAAGVYGWYRTHPPEPAASAPADAPPQ
jgi:hypothetical protein